jgi:NADPH:quinone reductase-like Zn-dependent oxidoreductase
VAKKPAGVSFEEAAGVNIAARTALQGIRDHAGVQPAQKVLINGASGGIGTFAIQIAKWLGTEVTAVCSTGNMDLVWSLGADHVIDYTKDDFSKSDERFDVIFDLVGDKPLSVLRRVLKPKGKWIGGGVLGKEASLIKILPGLFTPPVMSLFSEQKFMSFMTKRNEGDLPTIAELMEAGNIKTVIDRTFTLDKAPEAVTYVASKRARGKVVISIN